MNYSVKINNYSKIWKVISDEGINLKNYKEENPEYTIYVSLNDSPKKIKLKDIEAIYTQNDINLEKFNPNFNLSVLNLISEDSNEYKNLDIEQMRILLVQTQKMFNDINTNCKITEFKKIK
jgi:hypothetical protein